MIGSGLKKLAQENGMKVSNGVGYGSLHGYATTLSEGNGWKRICIATKFTDITDRNNFQNALNAYNLNRDYRVREIKYLSDGIDIFFNDSVGTMNKITEFINLFYPLLKEHGATDSTICTECGNPLGSDVNWTLINGSIAVPMHEGGVQKVKNNIEYEKEELKQNDTGSYPLGAVGALIGSAIGSLLWAVIFAFGYIAAPAAFVIGWLADKGYNMLHGKNGKGKIAILIVAIIFGVVAGTLIGESFALAAAINAGEIPGFVLGDVPDLMIYLLVTDPTVFLPNILMGFLFAALGVFALIRKTSREVSGATIVDLE